MYIPLLSDKSFSLSFIGIYHLSNYLRLLITFKILLFLLDTVCCHSHNQTYIYFIDLTLTVTYLYIATPYVTVVLGLNFLEPKVCITT